jgi:hypothetical protein
MEGSGRVDLAFLLALTHRNESLRASTVSASSSALVPSIMRRTIALSSSDTPGAPFTAGGYTLPGAT